MLDLGAMSVKDLKRASIISHALHSRLQMIRGKLYCRKDFTVDEFIDANRELIEQASESVRKRHDLAVTNIPHWREAAEMFLTSLEQSPNGL